MSPRLFVIFTVDQRVSKSLCPISLIEVGDEIMCGNFPSLLLRPFAQGFMAIFGSFRNKKATNDLWNSQAIIFEACRYGVLLLELRVQWLYQLEVMFFAGDAMVVDAWD